MTASAAGDRVRLQGDAGKLEFFFVLQHSDCLIPDLREDLADLDKVVERSLVETKIKSRVRR